ncbi:unnamed protein product [Heterobilharzia americana]|nr:unnamed protein product [Heterobilharzia americana]
MLRVILRDNVSEFLINVYICVDMASQRTDSPGITQSANENNNYGIAYSPNATTASLLDSRPYGAALILPTATQLSLDISLDRDLSFTYTTSIFSTATNTITGSSSVPGV